ncbi:MULTISPECIES: histone deacetylase [unclassified Leptolyngbya]|uniref:histone deacetylase family protein n=1 Tax=unclassified Leptolyngbya TaxID=2650499 RepID=UPI001684967C|nr:MULTISPECIES: histone deacetylase [unclassified Leptolyngbya]MBD1913284.1 histone deacetylase [Leptolyngbya sp. FACHB-8]MBD2154373.1 histone deacetylase [Leptolyngbya sp. FACHB-16]
MLPVFYSDLFLEHDTGRYHPENSGRLKAVTTLLRSVGWAEQLDWRSPTPPEAQGRLTDALYAIHPEKYVAAVEYLAKQGGGHVDPDTVLSKHSYEAAILAVSAWLDGVDVVLDTGKPAFVLARPPGHHALPTQGMGFCIFSNVAIAAHYALKQPGIQRVAILDWDVHHGNGTQAIVESNPQIAFCSLHESPQYPGTGASGETGVHNNVLNLPMRAGSTVADYKTRFEERIIPFFQAFQPDLLLVSAGYDANAADPLANISLQPGDYGIFTDYCLQLTSKVLFGLEGGYDYDALAKSVAATIERCLVLS